MLEIEVAYATPEQQMIVELSLPEGANAGQAVQSSGLLSRFAEIKAAELKLGIFSKPCPFDQPLKTGDRVEIYRPLAQDPKQARRQRAAKS